MQTKLHQYTEVDLHITLHLFEHRYPWVEVSYFKQRVEEQAKKLIKWIRHVENCSMKSIVLWKRQTDSVRNSIRGREKGYMRVSII